MSFFMWKNVVLLNLRLLFHTDEQEFERKVEEKNGDYYPEFQFRRAM